MLLQKISDTLYHYKDKESGMHFTLTRGQRGVYGIGTAWYLDSRVDGTNVSVATFCIKDDNRQCYLQDHGGKLWTTEEAVTEADKLIRKMLCMPEEDPEGETSAFGYLLKCGYSWGYDEHDERFATFEEAWTEALIKAINEADSASADHGCEIQVKVDHDEAKIVIEYLYDGETCIIGVVEE